MKRNLAIILLLILIITGCSRRNNSYVDNVPKSAIDSDKSIAVNDERLKENQDSNIKCKNSSESVESDNLVERFINAINKTDIELLMSCVNLYDQRKDGLQKAIEYYKAYFNNQFLESYEYLQKKSDGSDISYMYSIFSNDGKKKNIIISKDGNEYFIGFDNFIRYSQFAEFKMNAFVKSLKDHNTKSLAFHIWNSMEPINSQGDIGIYPISEAEKVLKNYEQYFDLNTISFEFTGNTTLDNGDGYFVFKVNGKCDNEYKQHKINIMYGDGQVGIEDEWITKMYSSEIQNYDIINTKTDIIIR